MADTSVKYLHSAMPGAPVLSGTAGALIAVLDACLVNGFGLGTLDSLVIAGGIATATRAAGHSQEVGSVVLIAGATVTGGVINGEQKVLSATATAFTFATTLANQTATGTITNKLAPAGWAKTYTDTNKAAYKPSDVTATGCLLRVDDSTTKTARVVGYESMTGIDTGTGPFPTATQRSGGCWWTKSDSATSASRQWMLVSDGKMFYFAREYAFAGWPNAYELHVFGDCNPEKSGDAFCCVLSGEASDRSSSALNSTDNYWYSSASAAELYMPRSYTALGSSSKMRKCMSAMLAVNTTWSSGQLSSTPYPNGPNGGLYTVPHYLSEDSNLMLRAVSPGFYGVPQLIPNGQFTTRDSVTGVAGMLGKTLKALTCTAGTYGVCFFDITGPWR